jgi:ubiquitin-protein ligase
MSIREDRLTNDYRGLQKLCAFNEPVKVKILEQRGTPPEYYRIQLSNCKGVELVVGETPRYRTEHIIIVNNFPLAYPDPGQIPNVKMETPLYHPNVFSHGGFCFRGSEFETLSQPLDALVKRVISMIQYQIDRYGIPANQAAKDWANRNKHLFPLSGDLNISQLKPKLNWK